MTTKNARATKARKVEGEIPVAAKLGAEAVEAKPPTLQGRQIGPQAAGDVGDEGGPDLFRLAELPGIEPCGRDPDRGLARLAVKLGIDHVHEGGLALTPGRIDGDGQRRPRLLGKNEVGHGALRRA